MGEKIEVQDHEECRLKGVGDLIEEKAAVKLGPFQYIVKSQ